MKKFVSNLFAALICTTVFTPAPATAQTGEMPFQLALFNPIQLRSEDTSILYLRFSFLYGKNTYIKGFDLGLANHNTAGESIGLQMGAVGYVEADFKGFQNNWAVNITKENFEGFQLGFYSEIGQSRGVQWGIINKAWNIRGFQFGLVNFAESM